MREDIDNDAFINKILRRKKKHNIVYLEIDMGYLSMKNKIMFMTKKILSIKFKKARVVLLFWDDMVKLINLFKYFKVNDYHIIKQYKNRPSAPGMINIQVNSFNRDFIKRLIERQYGVDFSHKDAIDVKCIYIYELPDGNIKIIYNYDDRGFREYMVIKNESL